MKTIYSPYYPIVDKERELIIELNETRNKYLFWLHSILTVLILCAGAVFYIIMSNSGEKTFGTIMLVLSSISSLFIAFETYITRLEIKNNIITIQKKNVIRNNIVTNYIVDNQQKIVFKIFNGKGGGGNFYLANENKSRIKIFVIPMYDLDKKNAILIGQKISNILKIPFDSES